MSGFIDFIIEYPEGVVEIKNSAFSRTAIETLEIPDSVDVIEDYVVSDCWNFKGAKVPQNANHIAKHALATSFVRD